MAKATSGWIPTMTVSAPRRRAIRARLRSVREANESRTSSAATSMMTPRDRQAPICSTRSSWNLTSSRSRRAVWMDAMRKSPCLSIETSFAWGGSESARATVLRSRHLETQQALRLFDTSLQVADRVHLAQVDADRHQRLGDVGGQAGDDDARPHEPRGVDGLDQMLGQLTGALAVEQADDGQDQQALADL